MRTAVYGMSGFHVCNLGLYLYIRRPYHTMVLSSFRDDGFSDYFCRVFLRVCLRVLYR